MNIIAALFQNNCPNNTCSVQTALKMVLPIIGTHKIGQKCILFFLVIIFFHFYLGVSQNS